MSTARSATAALALAAALSGCASYSAVAPGATVIDDRLTVTATQEWVDVNERFSFEGVDAQWTIDGPSLNALYFVVGVEDGAPLYRPRSNDAERQLPVWRKGMSELEVKELIEATLVQTLGSGAPRTLAFAPMTFLGGAGFELELEYVNRDGLELRGYAAGVERDGELHLMFFNAPRVHFFQKDIAEVREIARSATLSPPA